MSSCEVVDNMLIYAACCHMALVFAIMHLYNFFVIFHFFCPFLFLFFFSLLFFFILVLINKTECSMIPVCPSLICFFFKLGGNNIEGIKSPNICFMFVFYVSFYVYVWTDYVDLTWERVFIYIWEEFDMGICSWRLSWDNPAQLRGC